MKKETKDLNKWGDILFSWTGRLNTVKMSVLPKLIYRVSTIPFKIPMGFFVDTDKTILIFIWKNKEVK